MKTIRLYMFMALIFIFSIAVTASHLSQLAICDNKGGTEKVLDKVTVCAGTVVYKVLDSTPSLAKTNAKPFTDTTHTTHITFLYDEPAPGAKKAVRAILTSTLDKELSFPLGTFANNFAAGQSLMLILDGEYYLLTTSTVADLFSFEKTKLAHIPTKKEFAPKSVPGTPWYTFQTLGQKTIAVGVLENEVKISSLGPGEAPAAYVTPYSLTQLHEVQFTFNTPVKILDPSLVGQLAICKTDNKADTQQALVCRNDAEQFTLKRNVLELRDLNGEKYAFLYEVVNNEKQVSVFTIQDLSRTLDFMLGDTRKLVYNDFINSVIVGRRMAVKFNERLYLLHHPVSPIISLLNLQLIAYEGAATTTLKAAGSEDLVEFTGLEGEKIFLQRNYGVPPPPFELSGKSVEELKPVNLKEDLFTSLSSKGAVTIVNPAFGKVSAASDDTKLYQPTFKVFSTEKKLAYTLPYRQPLVVDGSTLFYYHAAEIAGAKPIKTALIYQFYDLSKQAQKRPFNDVFVASFTGGRELALQYNQAYYLLGHKGNPGAVKFYDPAQLTLRYLNGTESFPVTVEGGDAQFTIPDGRITVKVNIEEKVMTFSAVSIEKLAAAVKFTEYMSELTPANLVEFGDGTILRLCFKEVYAPLVSARLCGEKDTQKVFDAIADPAAGATPVLIIDNNKYVLEANGQTGEKKKVFIHSLLELKKGESLPLPKVQEQISWVKFSNDVLAKKYPVFNFSGALYLPLAQSPKLESLSFAPFPAGAPQQSIRNLKKLTPISFSGTFVLNDTVLLVEQQETQDEKIPLVVSFTAAEYSYLPDDGSFIRLNTAVGGSINFVTQLDQVPYMLKVSDVSGDLVKLSLQTGDDILLHRWFAKEEVRVLMHKDVRFEIKVQNIDKDKKSAMITVRRL